MKNFPRRVGTIDYEENGIKSIDLPRNQLVRSLMLRLAGTVTIGTAAATALKSESPYGLIKRIEIIADGRDTLKSWDFAALDFKDRILSGCANAFTAPGLTTAAHAFNAFAELHFALEGFKRPIDSLVPSGALQTFELRVTWGAGADILTPDTGTTFAFSSTNLTVHIDDSISSKRLGLMGNKELSLEKEITATSDAFQVPLSPGNFYPRLILKTTDAGVPESDIINNIKVQSGVNVYFNVDGADLRDHNKREFKLETMPAGYYVITFPRDGFAMQSLDTRKMSSLELMLNVTKGTGTTLLKVYTQELLVPQAPPAR